MINTNISLINSYVSGKRAYNNVEYISSYHRIQASEGYRQAANYCLKNFLEEGIHANIIEYPANNSTKYWTQSMFQEWNCKDAKLELVYPLNTMLADFKEDNLAIIQRSLPIDFRGSHIDVVYLESIDVEGDSQRLDLRGKIIFVSESPLNILDWAIKEKGAIGIITDYMSDVFVRQRNDLYDDRLFLSFSWMNCLEDKKTFGFVLTPRQGDELKKICMKMETDFQKGISKERYPKVTGYIDSEFKDGTIENVVATIPGEINEEIIIVAHLCHAKTCANDNASGCGGAIEVLKTINDLINQKKLAKPRRSIKLLLVPEVVGTFAFISGEEHNLSRIKAGINLDMIGRKQEGDSGLIGIMDVPHSSSSFLIDLAAYISEEVGRDYPTFNLDSFVNTIKIDILDYMGGSDHYILCDPTVGIPSLIMMQWLDKNYHSSADTVDKLDPKILKRTCSIAASYVYTLANLTTKDTLMIMNKTRERFSRQLLKLIRDDISGKYKDFSIGERIEYFKEVYLNATEDYIRFFQGHEHEEVRCYIEKEKKYLANYADELLRNYHKNEEIIGNDHINNISKVAIDNKYKSIPIRLFKGPISFMGFYDGLDVKHKEDYNNLKKKYPEFFGFNSINEFIVHRINGEDDILLIAKKVALEGRLYNLGYVYEYLCFLRNIGLVDFI